MAFPNIILSEFPPRYIERFWSYVDKTPGQGPQGECWEWKAARDTNGYGAFTGPKRQSLRAHRVAYFLVTGKQPSEMTCHECDNPPCCRGEHLFDGNHELNMQDCIAKGRNAKGERHGSHTHPEAVLRGNNHPMHINPQLAPRGDKHGSRLHPERRAKGERHGRCKFPDVVIQELLAAHQAGNYSQRKLATLYGMSQRNVWFIIHGQTRTS